MQSSTDTYLRKAYPFLAIIAFVFLGLTVNTLIYAASDDLSEKPSESSEVVSVISYDPETLVHDLRDPFGFTENQLAKLLYVSNQIPTNRDYLPALMAAVRNPKPLLNTYAASAFYFAEAEDDRSLRDEFIDLLRGGNNDQKLVAITVLPIWKDEQVVSDTLSATVARSSDFNAVVLSAIALRSFNYNESWPLRVIKTRLSAFDDDTFTQYARVIWHHSKGGDEMVLNHSYNGDERLDTMLGELASGQDPTLRKQSTIALCQMPKVVAEVKNTVTERIWDPDPEVRLAIVTQMGNYVHYLTPNEHYQILLRGLRDSDARVRLEAGKNLGAFGIAGVLDTVFEIALEDAVRVAAARSFLIKVEGNEALRPLQVIGIEASHFQDVLEDPHEMNTLSSYSKKRNFDAGVNGSVIRRAASRALKMLTPREAQPVENPINAKSTPKTGSDCPTNLSQLS